MNRSAIIDAARAYVGTPFHHQARLRGVGIDCIGLIVCVMRDVGLAPKDVKTYAPRDGGLLLKMLKEQLIETTWALPGDVVVFRMPHVAFVTGDTMIHAAEGLGVVEHRMDDRWEKRRTHTFALPGVDVPWLS